MFNSIDLNMLIPEMVPYIHTAMAIANVTLRKLHMFNQTTVDIMELFKGFPETTKAMRALNMSLDVVELLMTGSNSVRVSSCLTGHCQISDYCFIKSRCGKRLKTLITINLAN